jgi:hypothetical protein
MPAGDHLTETRCHSSQLSARFAPLTLISALRPSASGSRLCAVATASSLSSL